MKFEVLNIKKSEKAGCVDVKINHEAKGIVVIKERRVYNESYTNYKKFIIDGFKVVFNKNFEVVSIEQQYEVTGKKHRFNKTENAVDVVSTPKIENKITEEIEKEVNPPKKNEKIVHREYEHIKTCVEIGIPVYLSGPAGSGKNYTIKNIAKDLGLDFYFTNSVQQEYKITGFIDAGGVFHETEFYKAFKDGGLFFLDEMDASIPEVLILLNAAIANGYFEFPNGRIDANENFRVISAGNTIGRGADDNYTGRMVIDASTLDRFVLIEFGYDERVELDICKGDSELVGFIHSLREQAERFGMNNVFSYRCMEYIVKLMGTTMELEKILKITVFKGMTADDIRMFSFDSDFGKYGEAATRVAA